MVLCLVVIDSGDWVLFDVLGLGGFGIYVNFRVEIVVFIEVVGNK